MNITHQSKDQTWATPWPVIHYLESLFNVNFDLDVAAQDHTAKAPSYFTKEDNALDQTWFGHVYMNPPFGIGGKLQRQFMAKAIAELPNCRSITCLIPARTDTKLFHDLILPNAARIYFVKGRINFIQQGNDVGHASATFPSMVVHFKPNRGGRSWKQIIRGLPMPTHVRRGDKK